MPLNSDNIPRPSYDYCTSILDCVSLRTATCFEDRKHYFVMATSTIHSHDQFLRLVERLPPLCHRAIRN